jgi:hypothetical protein
MFRDDIKKVVSMISTSAGIACATMFREILGIFIFTWEFFCTKEQHVFTEMGKAWQLCWITEISC